MQIYRLKRDFLLVFVLSLGLISCSEDKTFITHDGAWGLQEPVIETHTGQRLVMSYVSKDNFGELRTSDQLIFEGLAQKNIVLRSHTECIESERAHPRFTKTLERPLKAKTPFYEFLPAEALYASDANPLKSLVCSTRFEAINENSDVHRFSLLVFKLVSSRQENSLSLREGIYQIKAPENSFPAIPEDELNRFSLQTSNPDAASFEIICQTLRASHPASSRAISLNQFEFNPLIEYLSFDLFASENSPNQVCRAFSMDPTSAVIEMSPFFILKMSYLLPTLEGFQPTPTLNIISLNNERVILQKNPIGTFLLKNPHNNKVLNFYFDKSALPKTEVTLVGGVRAKGRERVGQKFTLPVVLDYFPSHYVKKTSHYDIITLPPNSQMKINLRINSHKRLICKSLNGFFINSANHTTLLHQIYSLDAGLNDINTIQSIELIESVKHWIPIGKSSAAPSEKIVESPKLCKLR